MIQPRSQTTLQTVLPEPDARWVREVAAITGRSVSELLRDAWYHYAGRAPTTVSDDLRP